MKRIPCISLFLVVAFVFSACSIPITTSPEPIIGIPPFLLTLYVSTGGNDANDCLNEATACQTLAAAIHKSVANSLIIVGPGEFHEIRSDAQISHDLTIRGAGRDLTTIFSERYDVVIHVTANVNVTVSDLTVDGTAIPVGIGVAMQDGANVTLRNCRVRNNTWYGVRNYGNLLTIQNCNIEDNHIGVENHNNLQMSDSIVRGGDGNPGSAGLYNTGSADLENVTFGSAGAVDPERWAFTPAVINTGTLVMNGGEIGNSTAVGLENSGTATITSVNIHNNAGMGIWHQEGHLDVYSSIIRGNGGYGIAVGGRIDITPGSVNVEQSALLENYSAGLRMDGGEVRIQNVTISGNNATSSGGGGIWVYGGNLLLLDSTVAFNNGYGLDVFDGGSTHSVLTVRRSVVAVNVGAECQIYPGATVNFDLRTYACNDAQTAASLGLGSLSEDSGTLIIPLQADSPLINAGGPVALCPSGDQRGFPRPIGTTCDIGAFEYGATSAALVIATPGKPTPDILLVATNTPTVQPAAQVIPNVNAYCRKGPGTLYDQVTVLQMGTAYNVIGRDSQNTWWQVQAPDNPDCWVGNANVSTQGPVEQISIVQGLPLPQTPASFVNSFVCDTKLKTLRVSLTWTEVPGATGYRIYRQQPNNDAVYTLTRDNMVYLGDSMVSFDDEEAQMEDGLVYELEAFNNNGVAARISTSVPACK